MSEIVKAHPVPYGISRKETPATYTYIQLYGAENCASKWDVPPRFKSAEEMYMECLIKKKTWQELTNFKGYKKGVVL